MMSNVIVSEVVKHLELLPQNLQTQALNFVRRLSSVRKREASEVPSVSQVVERIKALPPNLAMITAPQGSLADALRDEPTDVKFDLNRWKQEWAVAEDELNRINREDDIAEGRI